MLFSIIVCTYNRSSHLKKCLDSILENDFDKTNYEVLVVDNNSKDDTKEVIYSYMYANKNIRYVFEQNTGLSHARNKGLSMSKGEYLIFFDDDTIVDENYLIEVQKFCIKEKGFVCGAGKIVPIWNCEKPKWFTDSFASIVGETVYGECDRELKGIETPIGANMIFKRKIFDEIGNFNVNLGLIGDKLFLGEENDLCTRIRNKGCKLHYLSKAEVKHTVHDRKVDKDYIFKRITLEGRCFANYQKESAGTFLKIKMVAVRIGILLFRDIPLLIVGRNKFEKKCKMKRSGIYIRAMLISSDGK